MGTKSNPGKHDCYDDIGPDEPFFVLRGRDPRAGLLVALWSYAYGAAKGGDDMPPEAEEKWGEAVSCAQAMFDFALKADKSKDELRETLDIIVLSAEMLRDMVVRKGNLR